MKRVFFMQKKITKKDKSSNTTYSEDMKKILAQSDEIMTGQFDKGTTTTIM